MIISQAEFVLAACGFIPVAAAIIGSYGLLNGSMITSFVGYVGAILVAFNYTVELLRWSRPGSESLVMVGAVLAAGLVSLFFEPSFVEDVQEEAAEHGDEEGQEATGDQYEEIETPQL